MSDLPAGWEWTTVGEIASTSLGKMLDKKQATGHHPTPYLRNVNVRWGGFDLSHLASMDIRPDELDRVLAEPGDLIVCEGGEPGRSAVWRGPGVIALQKALHRVRPAPGVDAGYVALLLQHLAHSRQLEGLFTGTTIKHLPGEKLRLVPVPLPPTAEQERIVAAIEEHFSRLDAAAANTRRAARRLRTLETQTMASAFSGTYKVVPLAAIASVGSGATPNRSSVRYWESGRIPWVTSGALNNGVVTEPSALITDAALRETSVKLWPAGTVLVAMYGEGRTRGRAAELAFPSACNQACAAIRPDPKVLLPRYLRWFLNSRYERTRRLASGGVQPNLSLGLVKAMEVPLPPLSEQRETVEQLEAHAALLVRLDAQLADLGRRAESLRRSILTAAFSGKLVPQDPDDEPASALLERIRAERASAAGGPSRRRRRAGTATR